MASRHGHGRSKAPSTAGDRAKDWKAAAATLWWCWEGLQLTGKPTARKNCCWSNGYPLVFGKSFGVQRLTPPLVISDHFPGHVHFPLRYRRDIFCRLMTKPSGHRRFWSLTTRSLDQGQGSGCQKWCNWGTGFPFFFFLLQIASLALPTAKKIEIHFYVKIHTQSICIKGRGNMCCAH